eukprot:6000374-Prymnesium_polylepis.1
MVRAHARNLEQRALPCHVVLLAHGVPCRACTRAFVAVPTKSPPTSYCLSWGLGPEVLSQYMSAMRYGSNVTPVHGMITSVPRRRRPIVSIFSLSHM